MFGGITTPLVTCTMARTSELPIAPTPMRRSDVVMVETDLLPPLSVADLGPAVRTVTRASEALPVMTAVGICRPLVSWL